MKQILYNHSCEDELRNVSLKVTPARLGVLDALERADKPLDVTTIINFLKYNHIKANKVTVFRIMNAFAEKGLVQPIQLHEGKFRYEHGAKTDHHHFICESCGGIEDISDCTIETLERTILKKKGLVVRKHSLEFFGLCQNCQ